MATGDLVTYPGGHADALDGARPASETHLESPILLEVAVGPHQSCVCIILTDFCGGLGTLRPFLFQSLSFNLY